MIPEDVMNRNVVLPIMVTLGLVSSLLVGLRRKHEIRIRSDWLLSDGGRGQAGHRRASGSGHRRTCERPACVPVRWRIVPHLHEMRGYCVRRERDCRRRRGCLAARARRPPIRLRQQPFRGAPERFPGTQAADRTRQRRPARRRLRSADRGPGVPRKILRRLARRWSLLRQRDHLDSERRAGPAHRDRYRLRCQRPRCP